MSDHSAGLTNLQLLFLNRAGHEGFLKGFGKGKQNLDHALEPYRGVLQKVVRKLAHRAGIAKLSGAAFDLLSGEIARLSLVSLEPGIIELHTFRFDDRRTLPHHDSGRDTEEEEEDKKAAPKSDVDMMEVDMYNTSPPSQEAVVQQASAAAATVAASNTAGDQQKTYYLHVFCPRQIEDAAKRLGIPCKKIYGGNVETYNVGGWAVTGDNTLEAEMSLALAQYGVAPPKDPRLDDMSCSSWGSISSFDFEPEAALEDEIEENELRRQQLNREVLMMLALVGEEQEDDDEDDDDEEEDNDDEEEEFSDASS